MRRVWLFGGSLLAARGGGAAPRPDAGAAFDAAIAPGTDAARRGLPCEVDQLLELRCRSCHAVIPESDAPMSLITYDDLLALRFGRQVAVIALERMQKLADPMPPTGALPVEEIAPFAAWVAAGLPVGPCALP
jgi:hypothetical protein